MPREAALGSVLQEDRMLSVGALVSIWLGDGVPSWGAGIGECLSRNGLPRWGMALVSVCLEDGVP